MKNNEIELAGELNVMPNLLIIGGLEIPMTAFCEFQRSTSIVVTCDKSYNNGKFPAILEFLFDIRENDWSYYADKFVVYPSNPHYTKFAKSIVDGYKNGAENAKNQNNESLKDDYLRIADLFEKRFENIKNGKPYYADL